MGLPVRGGGHKRANSVLPLGPRADLAAAVDEAERFYDSLGLPVVFSMGAEAAEGLDAELAARGYRVVDPTLIMTRPLSDEDASVEPGGVEPAPTREWFERVVAGRRAHRTGSGHGQMERRAHPHRRSGSLRVFAGPAARPRGRGPGCDPAGVARDLLHGGATRGASPRACSGCAPRLALRREAARREAGVSGRHRGQHRCSRTLRERRLHGVGPYHYRIR